MPVRVLPNATLRGRSARKAGQESGPFLLTRAGTTLLLRKRLGAGGLRRVSGRRISVFWRNLGSALLAGASPNSKAVPERRVNAWLLVLAAKRIPHVFMPTNGAPRLFVPAVYEGVALHEIRAFEKEGRLPYIFPVSDDPLWPVLAILALVFAWHGLRFGWFGAHLFSPPFPADAAEWPARFGLDVYRARALHQWWRAVTALWLHADEGHLAANLGFGLIFCIPLCRRAGVGLGFALAVAAGTLGNVCNALTRESYVLSLGFSTALFGAVGALTALTAGDLLRFGDGRNAHRPPVHALFKALARRLMLPLGAGLALLGFLGGGGQERTDYAAHIWGFVCGMLAGACALPLDAWIRRGSPAQRHMAQVGIALTALCFVGAAWWIALTR